MCFSRTSFCQTHFSRIHFPGNNWEVRLDYPIIFCLKNAFRKMFLGKSRILPFSGKTHPWKARSTYIFQWWSTPTGCLYVLLWFPLTNIWINKFILFKNRIWEHAEVVMGPGQNFLTRVGSDQTFMVWVWILKISTKNVKFFNFFPFG